MGGGCNQGFGWDLAIPGGAQFTPRRKGPRREALQAHSHRVYEAPGTQPRVPGGLGAHCACTHPIASTRTSGTTATGPRPAPTSMHRGVQGLATRCLRGTAWFFLQAGVVCGWGMQSRFWLGFGQIQGVPSSPPGAKAPGARPLQAHSHRPIRVPRHPAARAWGPGGHCACTHPIASTRTSGHHSNGPASSTNKHAQGGPGPSHEVPEGHCMVFFAGWGGVWVGDANRDFGWDLAISRGCPVHPPAQRPQARGLAGTLTQAIRGPRHPAARAWGPGGHCACTHPIASTRTSGTPAKGPRPGQATHAQGGPGPSHRSLRGTAWFFFAGWGGVWVGDAIKVLAGIWPNPGGAQFTPRRKGPRREAFADTLTQCYTSPQAPSRACLGAWGALRMHPPHCQHPHERHHSNGPASSTNNSCTGGSRA